MNAISPRCARRLVGLDFSPGMLEVAKQEVVATDSEIELEFVLGNALELPFEDEFDLAITFGANGHVLPRDHGAFVAQIHKALRVGGRLVFCNQRNAVAMGCDILAGTRIQCGDACAKYSCATAICYVLSDFSLAGCRTATS